MFAEDIELIPLPLGDEAIEVSLLDLAQVVDADAMAERVLSLAERREYVRIGHPARRREWLSARVCLKAMLGRQDFVNNPRQCTIMKDGRGRPWLSLGYGRPGRPVYDCSLSHKGRFACAGASRLAHTRIGVDIEEVSPRLLRVAGAFVRDGDALIGSRPPEERLAMLWTLKEACAKAAGGGIGLALGAVVSTGGTAGQHQVRTEDGREYRGWCVLRDGYAVALCVGTEAVGATGARECTRTTTKEDRDDAQSAHPGREEGDLRAYPDVPLG
jgi:phosphopantetheinyl transferase